VAFRAGPPPEDAVHFMREFTCAGDAEARIRETTWRANNTPAMLFLGRRRVERASCHGSNRSFSRFLEPTSNRWNGGTYTRHGSAELKK
jgi:hypothetical protein